MADSLNFWFSTSSLEEPYDYTWYCYSFSIDYSTTGINKINTNCLERSPYFESIEEADEWLAEMKKGYGEVMVNPKLVKCERLQQLTYVE